MAKLIFMYCGVLIFVNIILASSLPNTYNIRINIGNSVSDDDHTVQLPNRLYIASTKRESDIDMDYYDDYNNLKRIENHNIFEPRKKIDGKKNRSKRETSRAGYSSNPDICQIYNHNLIKLWTTLAKYVLTKNYEVPNKMALHNVALIIQAYLDHQNYEDERNRHTTDLTNSSETNVTVIMNHIKNIITENLNEDSVSKIYEAIVNSVTVKLSSAENEECIKKSRDKLRENVEGVFRGYLKNSDCRRDDNANSDFVVDKINIENTEPNTMKLNEAITKNEAKKILRHLLQVREVQNCVYDAREKFLDTMKSVVYGYIRRLPKYYDIVNCSSSQPV